MKRISFGLLTLALAAFGGSASRAEDCNCAAPVCADCACQAADTGCDACGESCDVSCDPCHHDGGCFAEFEATYFRYHRADGVRVGDDSERLFRGPSSDESAEFDFELSPRITLGYMNCGGAGARIRYWDYNHSGDANNDRDFESNSWDNNRPGSFLDVDTKTVDVEGFKLIPLPCDVTLEVSAGIRYNDFTEKMHDVFSEDNSIFEDRSNEFDGWGGILGAELTYHATEHLAVFGRVRGAILMSDKDVHNELVGLGDFTSDVSLKDSTQGMVEIAIGAEYTRCCDCGAIFFVKGAGEWQNWFNYSSSFLNDGGNTGLGESIWTGASDVGFGGVTASVGWTR